MNERTVLRFSTAGSVDDGKSTLIGRLLYDAKSIFEDQLATLAATTARRGGVGGNANAELALDLALLTDGLIAEREQGITIDVAYRYFTTPARKFIIADTPGHEQYTRNMVTGASTADLAIVLLDARKGVLPQSIRHAAVASLLGTRHVVVAVNKMDLVDYSEARFEELRGAFSKVAEKLAIQEVQFIPMSALLGDMVVSRGARMDWYQGPTLLEYLESAESGEEAALPFRFPVQLVSRPGIPGTYVRGYMGRIESGSIAVGDPIVVLPGGRSSRVADIISLDGSHETAHAPQSVTLLLDDEIDISRGDTIVEADDAVEVGRHFSAMLCWLDADPLVPGRKYLVKHTTRLSKGVVESIDYRLDIENLEPARDIGLLQMNEIGRVSLKVRDALVLDNYSENRAVGGFILIDEHSHHTVAAGMIMPAGPADVAHG